MLVINKEIRFQDHWEYFQNIRFTAEDKEKDRLIWKFILSLKALPRDNKQHPTPFCRALREFDINTSSQYVALSSDGVLEARSRWAAHFPKGQYPSFDSVFGSWPWDFPDIKNYPEDMVKLKEKWFVTDWRAFVWKT